MDSYPSPWDRISTEPRIYRRYDSTRDIPPKQYPTPAQPGKRPVQWGSGKAPAVLDRATLDHLKAHTHTYPGKGSRQVIKRLIAQVEADWTYIARQEAVIAQRNKTIGELFERAIFYRLRFVRLQRVLLPPLRWVDYWRRRGRRARGGT